MVDVKLPLDNRAVGGGLRPAVLIAEAPMFLYILCRYDPIVDTVAPHGHPHEHVAAIWLELLKVHIERLAILKPKALDEGLRGQSAARMLLGHARSLDFNLDSIELEVIFTPEVRIERRAGLLHSGHIGQQMGLTPRFAERPRGI